MINQQKGFSLIEVLLSLMLVTTVALTLLNQQGQTRQLLTQLTKQTMTSQLFDDAHEGFYFGIDESHLGDSTMVRKLMP